MKDMSSCLMVLLSLMLLLTPMFPCSEAIGGMATMEASRSEMFDINVTDENRTRVMNLETYSATFPVQIRNVGNTTGVAHVFRETEEVNVTDPVPANGTVTVHVLITLSQDVLNRTLEFNLSVTPPGQNDTVRVYVIVPADPDFEIHSPLDRTVGIGDVVDLNFTVINTGNCDDRMEMVSINSSDPDIEASAQSLDGNLTPLLSPGISTRMAVRVTVPEDMAATWGGSPVTVSMRLRSTLDVNVTDQNTTQLTVEAFYNISIEMDTYELSCDPGESVEFPLSVYNRGNLLDTIQMSLHGVPAGWNYDFDPGSEIDVDHGSGRGVTLTVTTKEDESADDFTLRLTATSSGDEGGVLTVTEDMTVTVLQVHNFTLNVTGPDGPVQGGTNVTFLLNVTNLGNGKEVVSFTVRNLRGEWNAHMERWFISLDAGVSGEVALYIDTDDLSTAGEHTFDLVATSTGIWSVQIIEEIAVNITPVHDIELEMPDGDNFAVNPDIYRSLDIPLRLLNHGNDEENVTINISYPPNMPHDMLRLETENVSLLMSPFGQNGTMLRGYVSAMATPGVYDFDVRAESNDSVAVRTLTVNVTWRDVAVLEILFSKDEHGNYTNNDTFKVAFSEDFYIRIQVKNTGTVPLESVRVLITHGDDEILNQTIFDLDINETANLTTEYDVFFWGNLTVSGRAQINGDVNPRNNSMSEEIVIKEPDISGVTDAIFMCLIVAIIIVIVIIVVAIVVFIKLVK